MHSRLLAIPFFFPSPFNLLIAGNSQIWNHIQPVSQGGRTKRSNKGGVVSERDWLCARGPSKPPTHRQIRYGTAQAPHKRTWGNDWAWCVCLCVCVCARVLVWRDRQTGMWLRSTEFHRSVTLKSVYDNISFIFIKSFFMVGSGSVCWKIVQTQAIFRPSMKLA